MNKFWGMALLALVACTSSKPPLDYIGPNMVDGPSLKAQRADCRSGECMPGMRVPPQGTIPTTYEPYPYSKAESELAGERLKNPLRPTRPILERGQKLYENFCVVCHGPRGDGAGSIVPKFPQPPPLFSEKATQWPDGHIFHIITRGQNLMPSYASQITADERWAIVHFVRVLQRAAHPTNEDIKGMK